MIVIAHSTSAAFASGRRVMVRLVPTPLDIYLDGPRQVPELAGSILPPIFFKAKLGLPSGRLYVNYNYRDDGCTRAVRARFFLSHDENSALMQGLANILVLLPGKIRGRLCLN
ncbi:hypothetical protein [Sphingorhabdus lacus]|uniref:Uncharacterized protein n=1 Tax=Sphingorhabdus lacus TaxID=392610 RepID=A0A6I6L183_9SPHN|nr:hypothetical protein [Sphingorhabdus lacus]QGY79240.1 hypothetical protein EUU25_00565 [Sphingorhabdus lacus]